MDQFEAFKTKPFISCLLGNLSIILNMVLKQIIDDNFSNIRQ
jgi:hypothetical protein